MGRINIKSNIEIERNFIEKYLIKIRDFIRGRSSIILSIFIILIMISALAIFGVWKYSDHKARQLARFELVLENYEKTSRTDPNAGVQAIKDLTELSKSRNFGFVNEMVYYMMGNLYFKEKKFKEAKENLTLFAEKSSSPVFKPLALLKTGIAMEELGDMKGAMSLYLDMEKKYSDSEVMDQVLFNIARAYAGDNKIEDSRKYYNKVITLYPASVFAEKSKKRLLLLGLKK